MPAALWTITLEEGSDFDLQLLYEDNCDPVDVTGYGAIFQIRNDPDAAALVTASVANSQITIAGTTGQFDINIPAASVSAIRDLIDDDAKYTFIIWPTASTASVDPKRLLEGRVKYTRSYASTS